MLRRSLLLGVWTSFIAACGGSDAPPPAPAPIPSATPSPTPAPTPTPSPPFGSINAVIEYVPETSSSALPYLSVSPLPLGPLGGPLRMGTSTITKVELLIFGFDMQTLDGPNVVDKYDPRERYFFAIPPLFKTAPNYACGTGAFFSEVRITDINGLMLSVKFEICQNTPLSVTAHTP